MEKIIQLIVQRSCSIPIMCDHLFFIKPKPLSRNSFLSKILLNRPGFPAQTHKVHRVREGPGLSLGSFHEITDEHSCVCGFLHIKFI